MFGLLNSSQIYGLQEAHEHHISSTLSISQANNNHNNTINTNNTASLKKQQKHNRRRASSNVSESVKTEKSFFATLASMHGGLKAPTTNFIEKFLNKTDLLSGGYDTFRNYTNFQYFTTTNTEILNTRCTSSTPTPAPSPTRPASAADTLLANFNCLQGSYRTSCDSEFYEAINVNNNTNSNNSNSNNYNSTNNNRNKKTKAKQQHWHSLPTATSEMTIKCSKNLLAEPPQIQAPATLQNYQKLPDDMDMIMAPSSGASSGEFNNDANNTLAATTNTSNSNTGSNNLYKRLSWGSRNAKNLDGNTTTPAHQTLANEVPSDNSTSSISTTTTNSSTSANTTSTSAKSNDLQRTSSASSSSGEGVQLRERNKKTLAGAGVSTLESNINANIPLTPERAQRRKLMQMISNYDQQNKQLQRELAKEKRRRTEELACVVKSLICFESKLKNDMKTVNQRLIEKDVEICRLVQQNRALKKKLAEMQKLQSEQACDEGVVEDAAAEEVVEMRRHDPVVTSDDLMEDCLVLEALQCINCKKQFYDIDLNEITDMGGNGGNCSNKDGGNRKLDTHHTNGHGSSSDDTVSSSFYGARRSVRYTSKRTSGTFRDYMRSRSMNIDDPALEQNSEENASTISHDDSQTSYEKVNIYSRTIERMHGVKSGAEVDSIQHPDGGEDGKRTSSRLSNRSKSSSTSSKADAVEKMEEDDGIFSPTQDDDYDEFGEAQSSATPIGTAENRSLKIVQRRNREFSEASPKQVYETSTDDWYASASDQEEIVISSNTTAKSYGQGAVNPVLECVNQILLQQAMEEAPPTPSTPKIVVVKSEPTTPSSCMATGNKNSNLVANNLPRRSSLSGRRSSRSNSHSSDGAVTPRNGTLTRKRVHFSTKNSMVHVPRNDDLDDGDNNDEMHDITTPMISDMQAANAAHQNFHYGVAAAADAVTAVEDTLNYESIYSNEYEPIGSEHNSSNLYVDMDANNKLQSTTTVDAKSGKIPPALPPKPANLLKFKKPLHQLDELADDQDPSAGSCANSEPDYCTISEVNVGVTSVQIFADVHKVPESVASMDTTGHSDMDLEVSTVASDDDLCAASQKTDEIEEIFADIPKLPNVAAIIAPKQKNKYESHQQQQLPSSKQDVYMLMTPKLPNSNLKLQQANKSLLNTTPQTRPSHLRLDLATSTTSSQRPNIHGQYKRKHMPNILAEINKRMSLPSTPTTPTKPPVTTPTKLKSSPGHSPQLLKSIDEKNTSLPLQAEFDWYNLDAEYGRATTLNTNDALKGNDSHNSSGMLADIKEDHESVVAAADEYNLDEEFSLASDKTENDYVPEEEEQTQMAIKLLPKPALITAVSVTGPSNVICEAINFPLIETENSPVIPLRPPNNKAIKIKKNLANFEKFIEGSGLSNKPLPSKRKIYFAGPFV